MGFRIEQVTPQGQGLPIGLYDADVIDVSDPETKADIFNEGKMRTQFHMVLSLTGNGLEDAAEQWYWVTVPPKLLSERFLSPKSTLFKVLEALGYEIDPESPMDIDTDEWIGRPCQALVEPTEDGKDTKITRLLPARKARTAARSAPTARPAARPADDWPSDVPPRAASPVEERVANLQAQNNADEWQALRDAMFEQGIGKAAMEGILGQFSQAGFDEWRAAFPERTIGSLIAGAKQVQPLTERLGVGVAK